MEEEYNGIYQNGELADDMVYPPPSEMTPPPKPPDVLYPGGSRDFDEFAQPKPGGEVFGQPAGPLESILPGVAPDTQKLIMYGAIGLGLFLILRK